MDIAPTKDEAVVNHNTRQQNCKDTMTIYTDGSGINGKVGAAAIDLENGIKAHQHLGAEIKYNVYAAELAGIHMALIQWHANLNKYPICRIYSDSQAAGKSLSQPRKQSGQAIIKAILDSIDDISIKNPQSHLEIIWIPGHQDIMGNEQADTEAKYAANNPTASPRFMHNPLKSLRVQQIKALAKAQWAKTWTDNTVMAKQLHRIMSRENKTEGSKIYNSLPNRRSCAMIVQLRTGHCSLNHYLHRFGIRYSPYCECGYGKETVEHFLLECKNYRAERKRLRENVGTGQMKLTSLLGNEKFIHHTLTYINETNRFQ